jgi:predicted dehydrogenase
MTANPLRVAAIGAGAFGRNHLRIVQQSGSAVLAGVYDPNPERAQAAAAEFNCPIFESLAAAAANCDASIVAAPTTFHREIACALLEAGRDVLVEKPIAASVEEAEAVVATAARHARILQVGHLERFNPAVIALEKLITIPLFFEIHRLSLFTPRSLDIDVVMDLMIHDLDILLSMTGVMPEEVRAAGIRILSPKVDIANVRLAFPGGCVANLTASRVSTERVRKLRVFQPREYISIDYSRQDGVAISVDENRKIGIKPLAVEKVEPLKLQFDAFVESCRTRTPPRTSGEAATRALRVAAMILDKIEEHAQVVAHTLEKR